MPAEGKQDIQMRADGYLRSADVARCIGRDQSTFNNHIKDGTVPGKRFGFYWFVDIWSYYAAVKKAGDLSPSILAELLRLRNLTKRPKETAE